jgi:hypothetical protein
VCVCLAVSSTRSLQLMCICFTGLFCVNCLHVVAFLSSFLLLLFCGSPELKAGRVQLHQLKARAHTPTRNISKSKGEVAWPC